MEFAITMFVSRRNRLGFKLNTELLSSVGSNKLMVSVSPEAARNGNECSLFVVTEESWVEKYLPLLESLPSNSADARRTQRLMIGYSCDIKVKSKRLKIPDALIRFLYSNDNKVISDRVCLSIESGNIYIRPLSHIRGKS